MADEHKEVIRKKLAAVRRSYASQLPDKITAIETEWRGCLEGAWNLERFRGLHRMVHTLAGSGGTFGFTGLGRAAREMEIQLKAALETGRKPTKAQVGRIEGRLSDLQAAWADTAAEVAAIVADASPGGTSEKKEPGNRLVFVLESDPDLLRELTRQLDYFGYLVRPFTTLRAFATALETDHPCAIIQDSRMSDGPSLDALATYQRGLARPVPAIVISTQGDLNSRLQAVRCGARAYFQKPFDIAALVDTLDLFSSTDVSESFRVLIVEDAPELSEHYALVLQGANMETRVINNPLDSLVALESFHPDLILMDVHMPHCSGLELAAIIRQQETYTGIPIVFLSSETDSEKHLYAMSLGGDDFLIKPIVPAHLVSSVLSRIKRAKTLRALINHDGLTGLLNHSTTKERLLLEMERTSRLKGHLSFAMVDLDTFKQVNDTYGHPTGDRVIKSLARLLKQRLRRTDLVGRFGGEEFAVILLDTDGPTAEGILDKIRDTFSQIEHRHEDVVFKKTFSCGIASYPGFSGSSGLIEAADRALYAAKDGGRNRVVLARS